MTLKECVELHQDELLALALADCKRMIQNFGHNSLKVANDVKLKILEDYYGSQETQQTTGD